MKHLILGLSLVIVNVVLANPTPITANVPGYIPLMIKPGTNVVSNLPFTKQFLPKLKEISVAKPGDTIMWGGETHTFNGSVWSGPMGGESHVPIHKPFTIIRTAIATDIWNVGGALDVDKAMKKR